MGFFSGLFRSRDKPQNRTTGSAYSFFFGGSSSGKRVNERSAMQMTAVYSCVRILAEAVAGLPLHLYRYKEDGGKEKALDHPLYLLLHDEPNPEMSSFVFRETLMTHLLLWGNAYAQIIRNGRGEVMALYPLMPDRMAVDRDDKGQLYYEYTTSADDAPISKSSIVRLKPSDVLHIPGLGFDGLVGYSPPHCDGKERHRPCHCHRGIRLQIFCKWRAAKRCAGASGNHQGPAEGAGFLDESVRGLGKQQQKSLCLRRG